MNKLQDLINKCKCSVSVEVNPNKDFYEGIESYLESNNLEVDLDVLNKMIEIDRMIIISFYPDTPIGFYTIVHYDLDKALDECLSTFN